MTENSRYGEICYSAEEPIGHTGRSKTAEYIWSKIQNTKRSKTGVFNPQDT